MNKNFIVTDKSNNVQKQASCILKFNLDSKDYLIYCIDENESNKQMFVSRLILNSEGKYFIDNIALEEKNRLSEIVYNIIILIPTNNKKGEAADGLLSSLTEKYKVTLSVDIPDIDVQEYYNNCSIAITSNELVNLAESFYSENLKKEEPVLKTVDVPTWNIPASPVANEPTVVASSANNDIASDTLAGFGNVQPMMNNSEPVQSAEPIPSVNAQNVSSVNTIPNSTVEPQVDALSNMSVDISNNSDSNVMPNPQAEKIAVVSDPSLTNITGQQPNIGKLNNKGKASVKYIIIGSVCILLAIAVVIVAYILIQKKTTGV